MLDELLLALLLFINGAFIVATTALALATDGTAVASVTVALHAA
jgi:hypothetical protein